MRSDGQTEEPLHRITISVLGDIEVTLDRDFKVGWDEVHDSS